MKKYIAIAAVLLLAVSCAKKAQQTQPVQNKPVEQQPAVQTDETAAWKTYSNEKIGFEIKLPSSWQAGDTDSSEIVFNNPENLEAFRKYAQWLVSKSMPRPADPQNNISVGYTEDITKLAKDLEEYVKSNADFVNPKKIVLAGQVAYRVKLTGMFDSDAIFVQKNNHLFSIYISTQPSANVEMSNKIISTFKFIDVTPKTTKVKVYFANAKLKNSESSCDEVFALEREIPQTPAIGTAAISELLKGLTPDEKSAGYVSYVPSGSKLKSLKIVKGVAYADFNKQTNSIKSVCNPLSAQIKQTLMQFSTVASVVLSVEGKTEDVFQP